MCFKHTRKSRSTSTSVALCLPPFISCSSSEMMFAFALNEIPKQANFPNESNLSFSSSARPSPHNAAAFVSTNDGRQGLRTPSFLKRFCSAAWLFSVSFLISTGDMVAIRHRPLFLKRESESESTACTGTAVHDPGLVGRFFASTSILPSVSRFIVGRLHPSTTLVLLVASSPSLRSCRRFLDLWLNRARGIPTEALLKFRGEALLRCFHFCSRVQ